MIDPGTIARLRDALTKAWATHSALGPASVRKLHPDDDTAALILDGDIPVATFRGIEDAHAFAAAFNLCRDHGSALLALADAVNWQPIETAPRNGLLLTFHPRFGQRLMIPDPHNEGWFLDARTGDPTQATTHWMPLPAAPSLVEGE